MTRKTLGITLLLCICICARPEIGQADAYKYPESSAPQEVVDGISTKLARGVSNMALGWLELPKQIYLTYKEDGIAKGVFIGPLKGVGMTLVRTVSGAGETATFFIPYPGFYDPYFDPPYVWEME
jgi:putative exosortase-associated protein (TIGR04073 family)